MVCCMSYWCVFRAFKILDNFLYRRGPAELFYKNSDNVIIFYQICLDYEENVIMSNTNNNTASFPDSAFNKHESLGSHNEKAPLANVWSRCWWSRCFRYYSWTACFIL